MTLTADKVSSGWLTRCGKYEVERMPMPHPLGRLDLLKPPAGVVHTIEGSLASGIGVFKKHYAPTFGIGPGRIVQFVPLGYMTAALENHFGGGETNRWARAQIEVEGHSQSTPYLFPPKILDPLAELLAALKIVAAIPLIRPYPDKLPPQPWATEKFKRRHDGKWGTVPGWYGHIEIPENEHWDPGALRWSTLIKTAESKLPKVPTTPAARPLYTIRAIAADGKSYSFKTREPGTKLAKFGVQNHHLVHVEIDRE